MSPRPDALPRQPDAEHFDLVGVGIALLRRRRFVVALSLVGALVATAIALVGPRQYVAVATFIPQKSESGASGIAAAASQLGLRLPSQEAGWGAGMYVELLRSNAVLAEIARGSYTRASGEKVALSELLRVDDEVPASRLERTIRKLRNRVIRASDDKLLGSVRVSVSTPWPVASFEMASALVDQVNRFNVEARNAQASVERQFAEEQAREAEQKLREAEDRLQRYLESNRSIGGSAELTVQRDRLQREVSLRQQVLTSLLQNREEARLREVRDVPGIVILESPEVPPLPVSRRLAARLAFGLVSGALVALVLLLLEGARTRAYTHGGRVAELAVLADDILPARWRDRRHAAARS
jgi:hypothetical protein